MDKLKRIFDGEKKDILKIILEVIIIIIMLYALRGEIRNLNVVELLKTLRAESNAKIVIILVAGLLSVAVTTLYDIVLCKDISITNISKLHIFKISWIANTTNNFVGLGGVTGGGLRTAFYKNEGVDIGKAINISLIIWMSTLSGLSALILFSLPIIYNLNSKIYLMVSLVIVMYIPFYLLIGKIVDKIPYLEKKLEKNVAIKLPLKIKLHMIGIAVLEWTVAGIFFSLIVDNFVTSVNIFQSLAIYAIATAIGICTFIPGGLGSFELACLYGFSLISIDTTKVILAILIYRIFYFVIPWILSLFILIEEFIIKKIKKRYELEDNSLINELGIKALAMMVFLSGIMLIILGYVPIMSNKIKFFRNLLSMPMLQFSQLAIMGIGIILVILSKGIVGKVKHSYYITVMVLILGAILSLIKGFNLQGAVWLLIIAILIYLSKDKFYRESTPMDTKNLVILFTSILLLSGIYDLIYNSFLNHNSVKGHIKFNNMLFDSKNIFYYLIIFSVSSIIFRLFMVKKPDFNKPANNDLIKLEKFLVKYKENSKEYLLFLKDKSLYYNDNDDVIIAFKVYRNKVIVLGDPIGNRELFKAVINDFGEYFDKFDMITIYYGVSEELLPLYKEKGYSSIKLGEKAMLDLNKLNLDGKFKSDLRTIIDKMKRSGSGLEKLNLNDNDQYLAYPNKLELPVTILDLFRVISKSPENN